MKRFNTLLSVIMVMTFSTSGWAQVATSASETATNQLMRDNAAKAKAAEDAKNANQPVQQVRLLGSQNVVTSSSNLNDQDKQLSENYIHQGMANQIIADNCKGDMATVCNGNQGKTKFLGVDSAMIKAVAQAYAMFGAMAGDSLGGLTKGSKGASKAATGDAAKTADTGAKTGADATKGADGAAADPAKKEKANDYCKFIPTATEGIATAVQAATSKSLEEVGNGETAQKDALLKAAKSHDSRAKMAQIQAAGWWGGAACYAVNAATGGFAVNTNLVLKMGAATLLGAFYQNEVSANKEYAAKTRAIADKLPGKGDCNPITDKLCYCSQPSTENDPVYCAIGLSKKTIAATSYRVACTTSDLKLDPSCSCEQSNTCFDTYLENAGEGTLNLGLGYATSPFKAVRSLARGELVGSTITNQAYDQTSAIAKRGLNEVASKVPVNNSNLNKDQKALVDAMMAKGIPANVATLMAQNPQNQNAVNAAMAKFSGAANYNAMASVGPKGSNIVDFSGGNGLGVGGNKTASNSGSEDLLAKLKGGKAAAPNSRVLEFAQRAEAQARQNGQIRKEETPLFEIISLRYQTSGRRLLQLDSNNN